MQQMLGLGPKVERAPEDGTMPWSTTVVNINRMRKRKLRRRIVIISLIALPIVACIMIGVVSSFYTSSRLASAPKVSVSSTLTPVPGWTPVSEFVWVRFLTPTPIK